MCLIEMFQCIYLCAFAQWIGWPGHSWPRSCDWKCDVTREKGCGPSGMGWGWGVRIIFSKSYFNLNPCDRDWDWNNLLRKLFWTDFTGIGIEIFCWENYSDQISSSPNSTYLESNALFESMHGAWMLMQWSNCKLDICLSSVNCLYTVLVLYKGVLWWASTVFVTKSMNYYLGCFILSRCVNHDA